MDENKKSESESFYQTLDKHLDKKYERTGNTNFKIGLIIPVLISFIGAYGLLVESTGLIITTLIKENYYCKELSRKLFTSWIGIYEFYYGTRKND